MRVAWTPLVAFAATVIGTAITVWGLFGAFRALESVEPQFRAQVLSDGIEVAMWGTLVFGPLAGVLYLVSAVAFVVGSVRPPSP